MRVIHATLSILVCLLLFNSNSFARENAINMGPTDGMALDQPRVQIQVIDEKSGEPKSLGPHLYNQCIYDTGANSIIVVGVSAKDLMDSGIVKQGGYLEQGVAGFTYFNVTAPYRFDFAGSYGVRERLDNAHIMYTDELNWGSLAGIVGMPAMVGRVVSLDQSVWAKGDIAYMVTDIMDEVPKSEGNRYSVDLNLVEFDPEGLENPGDPVPIWAPLPFVDVIAEHKTTEKRSYVLDTGAQLSIFSEDVAFGIGLDEDGDGTFEAEKMDEIAVGGIGGMVSMPLLMVKHIYVETEQGVTLAWDDVVVGVLDIHEKIGGVFGMDLLTAGWFRKIFMNGDNGSVFKVHFDFRNFDQLQGKMILDLNPDLNLP